MTTRLLLLTCPAAVAALMLVGCGSAPPTPATSADPAAAPSPVSGARGSEEQLKALAARATPHLADGRPDFNATWDHLGGIEFVRVRTEVAADGSVCVFGCAPPPGAAPGAGRGARRAGGPPPPMGPGTPTYKPEFLAKVQDLSKRQVEMDTVLQCHPPGVPRLGPPHKIIQNANELVFLYRRRERRLLPDRPDGWACAPHRHGAELSRRRGRPLRGRHLIVETRNLNEETWLTDNGAFHTADLKVTERLTRVGDTIRVRGGSRRSRMSWRRRGRCGR